MAGEEQEDTEAFVRRAIRDFLELMEVGRGDAAANLDRLEFLLDQLAWAYHLVPPVDLPTFDFGDALFRDYHEMRELAVSRFPEFSFYNIPSYVTRQIAESDVNVGDAIDDLADITCDLYAVEWCFENGDLGDALQTFSRRLQDAPSGSCSGAPRVRACCSLWGVGPLPKDLSEMNHRKSDKRNPALQFFFGVGGSHKEEDGVL